MRVTKVHLRRGLDIVVSGNLSTGLENKWRSKQGKPRLLWQRPGRARTAKRGSAGRVNALLHGLPRARSYLEIGVEHGFTLENVDVEQRWGVDPAPTFDLSRLPKGVRFFKETSDEFFQQLEQGTCFDVVFLDGLHTFEQTYKDLLNTLAHLREGAVLIDDTVPFDEVSAMPDQRASLAKRSELGLEGLWWHGDVWKIVVCIARHHPELEFRTILGPRSENPQTLLLGKHAGVEMAQIDEEDLREIAKLAYSDVFADGMPQLFRPCSGHEALSACLRAVAPRRSQPVYESRPRRSTT